MTKVHMTIATTNREQVNIPWLWRLGRDFDLKVNILKANINSEAARRRPTLLRCGWRRLNSKESVR